MFSAIVIQIGCVQELSGQQFEELITRKIFYKKKTNDKNQENICKQYYLNTNDVQVIIMWYIKYTNTFHIFVSYKS